jgi:anti-sigma28 factor (negative regulator of flagellin synthesis)
MWRFFMEHLVTSAAATAQPNPTEVAAPIPRSSPDPEQRHQRHRRILQLREAIESGEYRVCADDLADALLRSLRHSN